MSQQEQDISNLKTRSRSPSPITKNPSDILSVQKQLKDKEHELNIAYQTSLELIETNNELQQHLEEQNSTIQTLDANMLDYEMKIDMLEAENQEYQQTILQTNDKYEQLLGDLAVTHEHLNNSNDEIAEYQRTIQSLNHDIINNNKQINNTKHINNNYNNNTNYELIINESKDKLLKQQNKYDELLRECEKLRNESEQLFDSQIEIENMKKEQMKLEKRNKLLSDKIVELTYNNVQLEKEIGDYTLDISQQNETIKYLQSENQNLMTKKLQTENKSTINQISSEPNKLIDKTRLYSSYGGPDTSLSTFVNNNNSFVNNKENTDLKRRLSIQLKDHFSDNSKLVMFANTINNKNENDLDYNMNECENENELDEMDEIRSVGNFSEENDLFTMVQNYENNDEYLRNAEMDQEEEREEREDSFSQLSDKGNNNIQPIAEEKQSVDSLTVSPQSNELLANKSRHEKAIDKPRKGNKSSPKSSPIIQAVNTRRNASSMRSKTNRNKKRNYSRKTPTYRKTDALDEYLHLTASAVKINYPTVNATSKELIEMVKSLPFYQAHDHLNRYMMERLRWEQIQQNKLLQLKAAAIQSQRDHKLAQQSTVTRIFKKWFTTEYDNIDHIVHDTNVNNNQNNGKAKRDNKGKAKIIQTKTGGTSVTIGSLNPKGIPPKGTNKKRIIKSQHTRYSNKYNNKYYNDESNKKRKRDKKLKSLAMTQTLPSSHTHKNNKKVQQMAELHAKHINKIASENTITKDKHIKVKSIKINKQKKQKDNISNAEHHTMDNKRKKRNKRQQPLPPQQKQGWISWLTGTQQPPSQAVKRRDKNKKSLDRNEVRDPYALAPVQKKKRRRSDKDKNGKKVRKKSKSKSKSKESKDIAVKSVENSKEENDSKQEEVIDINEHIKNVIRMQDDSMDDEVDECIEKKNENDKVVDVMDENEEEVSSEKVVNDKLTLEKLPEFEGDDEQGNEEVVQKDIEENSDENKEVNEEVVVNESMEENINENVDSVSDKEIEIKEVKQDVEIEQNVIESENNNIEEQLNENKVNEQQQEDIKENSIEVTNEVIENIGTTETQINDKGNEQQQPEVEQVDDAKEDGMDKGQNNMKLINDRDNISESESYITEEEPINTQNMEDITTEIFDNNNNNTIPNDNMENDTKEIVIEEEVSLTAPSPIGSDANASLQNLNDRIDINDLPDIINEQATDPYALSPNDNKSEIESSFSKNMTELPQDDNSMNSTSNDNVNIDVIESNLADNSSDLDDILLPVQVKENDNNNEIQT